MVKVGLRLGIVGIMIWVLTGNFQVATAKLPPNLYFEMGNDWGDVEAPFALEDGQEMSWLHGRLGQYGDMDAFSATFSDAFEDWQLQILVPQCGDHFTSVFPSVALIGEGLAQDIDDLPFDLPDGMGALTFTEDDQAMPRLRGDWQIGTTTYYRSTPYTVDIPQGGDYSVVVWEPNGHVGAYLLMIGNIIYHDNAPDPQSLMDQLKGDVWMGQYCDAPVAIEECPITEGQSVASLPSATERQSVGEDFVLTGVVRDTETCLPIPNAQIFAELVNDEGEYDDDHRAIFYTNQQGAYRFDSNLPQSYGPPAHIHVSVVAEGYMGVDTAYFIENDEEVWGDLSINLQPE